MTGAVFAGTSKKFRLVDFFKEEIPTLGSQGLDALHKDGGKPDVKEGLADEYAPPLSIEELIQKVVTERSLKGADVVAAVESKDCVFREFQVPFTKDEQIRKVILYEAENFFPAFNMDDVVLEYLKVGEVNGKSQLIAVTLRNENIESRLQLMRRAGIEPLSLDLDAAALFNAFALTPLFNSTKSTLLVDMGATSTKIVLVEGSQLKKIRAFRTAAAVLRPDRMLAQPVAVTSGAEGGAGEGEAAGDTIFGGYTIEARFQEIENALRRLEPLAGGDPAASRASVGEELDLDTPIAILSDEEFARVEGAMLGDGPDAAEGGRGGVRENANGDLRNGDLRNGGSRNGGLNYRDYLERVGIEIQRTFATSKSQIELICLTGGMGAREEACRYFSEEFDVETIQLDFGDSFPSDVGPELMGDVSQYGAVAVGLAVKELGRDLAGLEFRKGRFRYEHRFTRLKYPILLLSVLGFLFFLQTAFWSYHEHQYQSQRVAGFEAEMENAYEAFFATKLTEGRDPLEAAKDQKKKWQGKGVSGVQRAVDFTEAVRNFAEVLNSSGLKFTITSMRFNLKARPNLSSGGKKGGLVAEKSEVQLLTQDGNAHLTLERKFQEPLSKYFDVKGSANPAPNNQGFKIVLELIIKPKVLADLE